MQTSRHQLVLGEEESTDDKGTTALGITADVIAEAYSVCDNEKNTADDELPQTISHQPRLLNSSSNNDVPDQVPKKIVKNTDTSKMQIKSDLSQEKLAFFDFHQKKVIADYDEVHEALGSWSSDEEYPTNNTPRMGKEPVKCVLCGFMSMRRLEMFNHIKRQHQDGRKVAQAKRNCKAKLCQWCNFTSPLWLNLVIHQIIYHTESRYSTQFYANQMWNTPPFRSLYHKFRESKAIAGDIDLPPDPFAGSGLPYLDDFPRNDVKISDIKASDVVEVSGYVIGKLLERAFEDHKTSKNAMSGSHCSGVRGNLSNMEMLELERRSCYSATKIGNRIHPRKNGPLGSSDILEFFSDMVRKRYCWFCTETALRDDVCRYGRFRSDAAITNHLFWHMNIKLFLCWEEGCDDQCAFDSHEALLIHIKSVRRMRKSRLNEDRSREVSAQTRKVYPRRRKTRKNDFGSKVISDHLSVIPVDPDRLDDSLSFEEDRYAIYQNKLRVGGLSQKNSSLAAGEVPSACIDPSPAILVSGVVTTHDTKSSQSVHPEPPFQHGASIPCSQYSSHKKCFHGVDKITVLFDDQLSFEESRFMFCSNLEANKEIGAEKPLVKENNVEIPVANYKRRKPSITKNRERLGERSKMSGRLTPSTDSDTSDDPNDPYYKTDEIDSLYLPKRMIEITEKQYSFRKRSKLDMPHSGYNSEDSRPDDGFLVPDQAESFVESDEFDFDGNTLCLEYGDSPYALDMTCLRDELMAGDSSESEDDESDNDKGKLELYAINKTGRTNPTFFQPIKDEIMEDVKDLKIEVKAEGEEKISIEKSIKTERILVPCPPNSYESDTAQPVVEPVSQTARKSISRIKAPDPRCKQPVLCIKKTRIKSEPSDKYLRRECDEGEPRPPPQYDTQPMIACAATEPKTPPKGAVGEEQPASPNAPLITPLSPSAFPMMSPGSPNAPRVRPYVPTEDTGHTLSESASLRQNDVIPCRCPVTSSNYKRCEYCSKRFKNLLCARIHYWVDHLQLPHNVDVMIPRTYATQLEMEEMLCPYCRIQILGRQCDAFELHILSHLQLFPYICSNCSFPAMSLKALSKHSCLGQRVKPLKSERKEESMTEVESEVKPSVTLCLDECEASIKPESN